VPRWAHARKLAQRLGEVAMRKLARAHRTDDRMANVATASA